MTPIDWARLTNNISRARPYTPPPATPAPEPTPDPDRATVLRITREDRDAAADRWPSPDEWRRGWPGTRHNLAEPSTLVPAPAWDGTDCGMCRYENAGGR